jgi:hypothetical protein
METDLSYTLSIARRASRGENVASYVASRRLTPRFCPGVTVKSSLSWGNTNRLANIGSHTRVPVTASWMVLTIQFTYNRVLINCITYLTHYPWCATYMRNMILSRCNNYRQHKCLPTSCSQATNLPSVSKWFTNEDGEMISHNWLRIQILWTWATDHHVSQKASNILANWYSTSESVHTFTASLFDVT